MTMENGDGEPYAHQDWRLFEELRSEKSTPFDELPDHVSCYVCKIQPKHCGKVVKELGYLLPLIKIDTKGRICDEAVRDDIGGHGHGSMPPIHVPVLGHLRRVRRIRVAPSTEEETNQHDHEPPKKRGRKSKMNRKSSPNVELEILIGAISHVNHLLHHVAASSSSGECKGLKLKELLNTHEINLEERVLPGRPAKSRTELDEWNSQNEGKGWWPSLYFEKQTLQFKQKELEIDMKEEWGMMRNGMLDAIKDALKFRKEAYSEGSCGVVIVCPKTQTTVASSYQEWKAQVEEEDDTFQDIKTKLQNHPLLTNCLLAIQGVSRLERLSAMGHGMDSEAFKNGQYLCTGYDCYLTKEPAVFESMALVHSRIRRVYFSVVNKEDGGLGGTGIQTSIYCLPGTNHRYRAFKCCDEERNELYTKCRDLHPEND